MSGMPSHLRLCDGCGDYYGASRCPVCDILPHDHSPCLEVPDPKPEPHKAPALERPVPGKEEGIPGVTVRFTGYRVRPLDPDNFAGSVKDVLDGLRHAHLIRGDEPWRIKLETEQVRVGSFKEEKTVVEIIEHGGSAAVCTDR